MSKLFQEWAMRKRIMIFLGQMSWDLNSWISNDTAIASLRELWPRRTRRFRLWENLLRFVFFVSMGKQLQTLFYLNRFCKVLEEPKWSIIIPERKCTLKSEFYVQILRQEGEQVVVAEARASNSKLWTYCKSAEFVCNFYFWPCFNCFGQTQQAAGQT
jgi:hypothetical protein